jgi:hypothetical protein
MYVQHLVDFILIYSIKHHDRITHFPQSSAYQFWCEFLRKASGTSKKLDSIKKITETKKKLLKMARNKQKLDHSLA